MNKFLIIICLTFGVMLSNTTNSFAQNQNDSIIIENNRVYKQNDKVLSAKQLLDITEINPKAFEEMKIAKSNSDFAMILSIAGGGLIGWPLGTALGGGDPQWYLAGIGAALIVITIPLASGFKKHAKNAVDIYNAGLNSPPKVDQTKTSFNIGMTSNGIGVVMHF